MTYWTEEMIKTLRRMRSSGCSDEEIGLALNKTPRAINGKRFRLGLTEILDEPLGIALRRQKREASRELIE